MSIIPILNAHDHQDVIGVATVKGNCLHVTFRDGGGLKEDDIYETFGNIGYRVISMEEINGTCVIREFEIMEFSIVSRLVIEKPQT
jgi:hypothetical protein